jgi:hypothetical protein
MLQRLFSSSFLLQESPASIRTLLPTSRDQGVYDALR